MSINRRMDKEYVRYTYTHSHTQYNGILLSHKNNEMLSFAMTWIDLEGIMLSDVKSDRERQILCVFTYTWNLKNKTYK